MESPRAMEVDCTDCPFSKIIPLDGEVIPAEVVIEHGQEYGHKLSVNPIEELPNEDTG